MDKRKVERAMRCKNLANQLMEDLKGSSIQVVYGIDRDICCSNARIEDIYFDISEK